jgi:hypothetical protein
MTGGQVIIDGSSGNFNTPIDHDPPQRGGGFVMTGGYILAVGSPGVPGIAPALMPNSTSTQYSVMVTYNTNKTAGTLIHLRAISGTELFTFKPAKIYRSFVFCSPELTKGTYEVYLDGNSTGTIQDGLYSGGTYTPGTKMNSFTITSIVTKIPKPPG